MLVDLLVQTNRSVILQQVLKKYILLTWKKMPDLKCPDRKQLKTEWGSDSIEEWVNRFWFLDSWHVCLSGMHIMFVWPVFLSGLSVCTPWLFRLFITSGRETKLWAIWQDCLNVQSLYLPSLSGLSVLGACSTCLSIRSGLCITGLKSFVYSSCLFCLLFWSVCRALFIYQWGRNMKLCICLDCRTVVSFVV